VSPEPPDLSPTGLSSAIQILSTAFHARAGLIDPEHKSAFRLFSGFYEGIPDLVIEIFSRTVVVFNYADEPDILQPLILETVELLLAQFPWLRAGVVKPRKAPTPEIRRGSLLFGESPDNRMQENGVLYAINLLLDQATSIYLDTRNLRIWAKERLSEYKVLNTFAYTGSLGVAARAGGASQVLHLDLDQKSLALAKESYKLNSFDVKNEEFLAGDFWVLTNRLRQSGALFDCVFIDAPFFAASNKGTVNLITGSERLINKVRPLVSHGGMLVVVNNALFVSGEQFIATLEKLCSSGYMEVNHLIPVPVDIAGYPDTRVRMPPSDPAPFNHPTKIAVLRVTRKDRRTA
jgi:23S rRNA (cytosine1962-C5)-methyltransferase